MSRRKKLPSSPRHVLIYDEDWQFLQEMFGKHTQQPIGPGAAICDIVHSKVKAFRAKIIGKLDDEAPGEDARNEQIAKLISQGASPEAP